MTHRAQRAPTVISFFTGAYGLDLGLESEGFTTVLACENHPASRKTLLRNFICSKVLIAIEDAHDKVSTFGVMSTFGERPLPPRPNIPVLGDIRSVTPKQIFEAVDSRLYASKATSGNPHGIKGCFETTMLVCQ